MKRLSKEERKAILRKMEFDKEVKEAISKTRHKYETISWRGIGLRKLQIIIEPSFKTSLGWDIRSQNNKLVLYEYEIDSEQNSIKPGYYLLNSEESKLEELMKCFYNTPIFLHMPPISIGLDGTNYEVALFTGFQSIRLKWWEETHENWFKVMELTKSAIEYFKTLEKIENGI